MVRLERHDVTVMSRDGGLGGEYSVADEAE